LRHKDGTDEFVETTLYHAIIKAFPGYMDNVFTAISHGIELPLDTSIGWIATNLSYPDNFIHIVLKFQKN
jgi:autophagy-related protein 5